MATALKKAYIDPKNQAVLWETIQPLVRRTSAPPGTVELWFRETVAHFYEDEQVAVSAPLYDALLELNKQTLRRMADQLRAKPAPPAPTPSWDLNNKMMQVVQGENALKFDQEKDTPIRNMDELLLEQRALRDRDVLPPLAAP